MSYLSKKLDFTVQEASRNIARLAEARLITKQTDGCFRLTPYGEETLNLLAGFDFLTKHREYFTTHTLSTIPKEFSNSIASLIDCQLVDDIMVAFANVENMIQKAKEHVWILSNQILVSTLPYLAEALKRGAEFKLILPTKLVPPKDARERINDPIYLQAIQQMKFESRYLESVDALICLSEKEVAALCFLNTDRKLDYRGFHATDEESLKWTETLFSHYWSIATPRKSEEF